MLTPIMPEAVPSVFCEDAMAEHIDAICEGGIVAFVMRSDDRAELNRFNIQEHFAEKGMSVDKIANLLIRHKPFMMGDGMTDYRLTSPADLPLHTDTTWQDRPRNFISIRMCAGIATAHLFRPAPAYVKAGQTDRGRGNLEAHRLFEMGLADTDVMEPIDNQAVLGPGAELVMRKDLFHYIQTTDFPRESMVRGVRSPGH